MKSTSVNGQNVPIDSSLFATSKTQGTFADSGTSLAYLPDGVYDPIINAVSFLLSKNQDLIVYTTSIILLYYMTVVMVHISLYADN